MAGATDGTIIPTIIATVISAFIGSGIITMCLTDSVPVAVPQPDAVLVAA